jgi:TQXA domain-containing protein/LPXTG-motif cell wall-anchored protein
MQSSTTSTRRRLATAAILGAGSAVLMAGTAHADGLFGAGVGAGKTTQEDPHAGTVALTNSKTPVATSLTVLETANGAADHDSNHLLWTYCIQQGVAVNPQETYDEKGWDNTEQAALGIDTQHLEGIKWILNNSYPKTADLTALATAAGITTPLTATEAVEATQAAIWNLSDSSGKTALDATNTTVNDANVIALYHYLQTAATGHMKDSGTPQLSLGISPSSVANVTAGDKVGPFTLTSSDPKTKFVNVVFDTDKGTTPPAGSTIVDKNGNEVTATTKLGDKDQVWVKIPDGASAGHIVLRASGQLPVMDTGRVFVTHDGKTSQNLIVAASQNVYVRDYVDIVWKAAPVTPSTPATSTPAATTPPVTPATTPPVVTPSTPALAHTGAGNTMAMAGGAAVLVAAGGGLVVYTRRTKRQGAH